MDLKKEIKNFWDSNPVDGFSENAHWRVEYRKRKDRWMADNILSLDYKGCMLSVGCGQGTDMILALEKMDQKDTLFGLDISLDSIKSAVRGIREVGAKKGNLIVINGDAEKLPFSDATFDIVWSWGVLHHTPDINAALAEIKRVLNRDGKLYLMLYRRTCPKGMAVRSLRWLSQVIDKITKKESYIYSKMKKSRAGEGHGTAFYELFGCPILNLYSYKELKTMLKDFKNLKIESYESGVYQELMFLPKPFNLLIPVIKRLDPPKNPLGFHWVISAEKG